VFFIGWKISHKTSFVRVHEMDFDTGRRELDLMDAMEREKEVKAVGTLNKFWQWVCLASSRFLRFVPEILQLIPTPNLR
jgi:hypothetical protein